MINGNLYINGETSQPIFLKMYIPTNVTKKYNILFPSRLNLFKVYHTNNTIDFKIAKKSVRAYVRTEKTAIPPYAR